MSARRIVAVTRRIAELFRRDRRTLALLIVAPLAILALLGWVIRGSAPQETRLVVVNADGAIGAGLANLLAEAGGDGAGCA